MTTLVDSSGDSAAAPPSNNPYSAPTSEGYLQRDLSLELNEPALKAVRAIVRDAGVFPWIILLTNCACPTLFPAVLVLLPWSLVRLAQGHALRNQFELLRRPNSFSPHVNEAIAFQSAMTRCWITVAWSGTLWIAIGIALFVWSSTVEILSGAL